MENATQTDALEEVKTSEDAPEVQNEFVSNRQKALEDIYEQRAEQIKEETFDDEDQEEIKSPVWHDGEDWKTKIKVDGEELEVPFDSLKSSHQKDKASQKRFEAASAKERILMAREQQLNQYVQRLNSQPPNKDADESVSESGSSDVDGIVEQYHAALFEDDAVEAARLLKTLSNSGRGNATQNVEEVVHRAIVSYDQSKKAEVQRVRQLAYQKSLEDAVKSFEEKYPDIAESPELRTVADNKTVTLVKDNPDWTPNEVIQAAAEYTREWAGTMPNSNGRLERKKKLVQQPKSVMASANIGSDQVPLSPSEIVQQMKKARGQLL
jgi:hypothetical protein